MQLIALGLSGLFGCANSDACMRHSDCLSDARCIQGACLIPLTPTTGVAGSATQSTMTRGGTTSSTTAPKGGTSASAGGGGTSNAPNVAGSAGQSESLDLNTSAYAGSAGTQ